MNRYNDISRQQNICKNESNEIVGILKYDEKMGKRRVTYISFC